MVDIELEGVVGRWLIMSFSDCDVDVGDGYYCSAVGSDTFYFEFGSSVGFSGCCDVCGQVGCVSCSYRWWVVVFKGLPVFGFVVVGGVLRVVYYDGGRVLVEFDLSCPDSLVRFGEFCVWRFKNSGVGGWRGFVGVCLLLFGSAFVTFVIGWCVGWF